MRDLRAWSADLLWRAPACGASSSPRRLWPFKLKAAAQETPPPASGDAIFQILSVFYLLSVNLLAEAEKRGRNMSPSARLKPGAWMCVCVCVSVPALFKSCWGGGVENRWMGVTGGLLRSLLELWDFSLINKLLGELFFGTSDDAGSSSGEQLSVSCLSFRWESIC